MGIDVLGDARFDEPTHGSAEQVRLVDRLRGTDSAQLRRAVGGDDDQRDTGLAGLDHRRMQLDGCGSAGRGDDRRPASGQAEPETDEARRTFVVLDVDPESAFVGEGEHQRRGP